MKHSIFKFKRIGSKQMDNAKGGNESDFWPQLFLRRERANFSFCSELVCLCRRKVDDVWVNMSVLLLAWSSGREQPCGLNSQTSFQLQGRTRMSSKTGVET